MADPVPPILIDEACPGAGSHKHATINAGSSADTNLRVSNRRRHPFEASMCLAPLCNWLTFKTVLLANVLREFVHCKLKFG